MKRLLSRLFSILFLSIFVLHGCSSNSKSKGDTRPDAFTISAQNDVEPDTLVESDPFTIEGINRPATVTLSGIEGATFSVNGGAPLSSGGTVNNGDQVVIQATSPDTYEDDATLTVDIGGERSEFVISTGPDETPPEVTILFPPPSTMTEGSTVFVRGTVEDLYGEVSTLLVNGVEVDIGEGLPEWSANVPLEEGENTISVTATDVAGNQNGDQSVNVRLDPTGGPFPDNENPSAMIGLSGDFVTTERGEWYLVTDFGFPQILLINLSTAARSIVVESSPEDVRPLKGAWFFVVENEEKGYVSDYDTVYEVDLVLGRKRILVAAESEELLGVPGSLALVEREGEKRLYISDGKKVFWMNVEGGDLNLLVSGETGETYPERGMEFGYIKSIHKSMDNRDLLILTESSLLSVDLSTSEISKIYEHPEESEFTDFDFLENGFIYITEAISSFVESDIIWLLPDHNEDLVLVSDAETPNTDNVFGWPSGIDCHERTGYCIVVDTATNSLYAMDRSSGHRVILTRSIQE